MTRSTRFRLRWWHVPVALLAIAAIVIAAGYGRARMSEQWEPVPPRVAPRELPGKPPPSGALVLLGKDGAGEWVSSEDGKPARWPVRDGVMTVDKAAGSIETRRRFGNYQLHVEWRVPADVTGSGQARGNSGLFLAHTASGDSGYEIQILDSFANQTYVNGQAGAIYKQHPPLANPARPPGEWQSYDVTWTAPVFTPAGKLKAPARVTLLFNGVLVQDDAVLSGETKFIGSPSYRPHGREPIMLQAHHDPSEPVSFRNIWLRELP